MTVLNALKPGVLWEDMHRLAEKVACEGLLKVKILIVINIRLLTVALH